MFFFRTRTLARDWANETGKKFVDMGADAPAGRRWAVRVL